MVWLWCARLAWVTLPVTTGDALAEALDGWERAPSLVATTILWAAWMSGLVALLAPRPWGLTLLRVVAPATIGVNAAAFADLGTSSAMVAVSASVVATTCALSAPVAEAAGNALAYGDERRYPLRIPTPLLAAPVPVAVAAVAAPALAPLLLAAGEPTAGVLLLVLGTPVALVLLRALHSLARRWVVLVPAGVVIVDPLTLVDPVLVRRELVERLGPPSGARDALDLRLGTTTGTLELHTREPATFLRRSGRAGGALVQADTVLVAPVRPAALLAAARARRIRVG